MPIQTAPERSSASVNNLVVAQRVGVCRVVAQMLDRARCGIQYVETRIAGSNPDATARIHEHRARGVARERAGFAGSWRKTVKVSLARFQRAIPPSLIAIQRS